MKESQIKKLRPSFKFGRMEMIDWFEINSSDSFYSIRSGLRNADGETKSPYYYESYTVGRGAKKIEIEKFTKFWDSINKEGQ